MDIDITTACDLTVPTAAGSTSKVQGVGARGKIRGELPHRTRGLHGGGTGETHRTPVHIRRRSQIAPQTAVSCGDGLHQYGQIECLRGEALPAAVFGAVDLARMCRTAWVPRPVPSSWAREAPRPLCHARPTSQLPCSSFSSRRSSASMRSFASSSNWRQKFRNATVSSSYRIMSKGLGVLRLLPPFVHRRGGRAWARVRLVLIATLIVNANSARGDHGARECPLNLDAVSDGLGEKLSERQGALFAVADHRR